MSKSWNFSDPHSLYLYPDCRTGLLGSFIGERLEVAREAEVSTGFHFYCWHCLTCHIIRFNTQSIYFGEINPCYAMLTKPVRGVWQPGRAEIK